MTRLASTYWAGVGLGLAFTSTAFAQYVPDSPPTTDAGPAGSVPDVPPPRTSPPPRTVPPARTVPPPGTAPSPTYVVPRTVLDDDDDDGEDDEDDDEPFTEIGIAIAAGGGVGGFTQDLARDFTDIGGDWDVRATIGTRTPLAFEGSYIGSAQQIDALGLDDDAILVGNGLQGALRVNTMLDYPIQPFVFAGAAWRQYDLDNTATNTSAVASADDVLEVPIGVGVSGRWRRLIVDTRGEFRASWREDLLPAIPAGELPALDDDPTARLHRWSVRATVGFEF